MQIGNKCTDKYRDFDIMAYTINKTNTAWQEAIDKDWLSAFEILHYTLLKNYKKEKFVIIHPLSKKIYTCDECPCLRSYLEGVEIKYRRQNFCLLNFDKTEVHKEVHELCLFRMKSQCK